jgi:sugar phosphate isomerase/epimerase
VIPTLFSVSYAGLWNQHALGVEAFIEKAAVLGYTAVELMAKRPHLSVVDTDERRLEQIRQCAAQNQIEIATIAAYTDFTAGKHAAEVPFVEIQVGYVRQLAYLAQQLGAKKIRVFTGYSTGETACAADWDICVKSVRECAAVAESYRIALGVQNHHDTAISTDAYLEFLSDVNHPNCYAMFDPWAPALHGDDLYAAALRLAPRMIQTTLADYVRLPRWAYVPGLINYQRLADMVRAVPLGQGFIDLRAFFRGLQEGGFKGHIAYEMCSPLRGGGSEANLDASAAESLRVIRTLIQKYQKPQ